MEVKEIYHLEEVSIVENWCEFFNKLEKNCVSISTFLCIKVAFYGLSEE